MISSKGLSLLINIPVVLVVLFSCPVNAKPYRGAELRTLESYKYGRFEVHMKSLAGSGMLSSFFTYHDGGVHWNEIDIEILGQYSDQVQFNTITPGQVNHVNSVTVDFNPHEGYHTYAIEWTPSYVNWFIDTVLVYSQAGGHISDLDVPQKLMMNVWQPLYPDWVGEFDEESLPVFAHYDWVSYYSYQPYSGNYGTGLLFKHEWTDDFDYWNRDRWAKATHTFGGNNVDFIHDNAVFYNGKMILCLTTPGDTGYDPVEWPTDQETVLYNNFEGIDSLDWGFWQGQEVFYPEPVTNPLVDSINGSGTVFKWWREENSSPFTNAFTSIPEKFDFSTNHTMAMKVYTAGIAVEVAVKLQNGDLNEPWSTEIVSRRQVSAENNWQLLFFDLSAAEDRTDLDQIIIQFAGENAGAGTYYFDDLFGPPVPGILLTEDIIPDSPEIEILCYPNPFNPITTIQYELPYRSDVQITISDMLGKEVVTLVSETQDPGSRSVRWDGTDVASGVYLCRIMAGEFAYTRKLVLLK